MSHGDTGTTLGRSRRSAVVLVLGFLLWAAIVIGYGAYLARTVVEGGLDAIPLGPTWTAVIAVVTIPWLHWRLSRGSTAR